MNRYDIITTILGNNNEANLYTHNTEEGEFSYVQALRSIGKSINDVIHNNDGHERVDIRFANERLTILVETKDLFNNWRTADIEQQLQDYVHLERAYSSNMIVAILIETRGTQVWVWIGQNPTITDENRKMNENVLKSFAEYENLCFGRVNDKIRVVDSINRLNEMLQADNIPERLRSQFVGTCLLALKNGLAYTDIRETIDDNGNTIQPQSIIINNMCGILQGLLIRNGGDNYNQKIEILRDRVLNNQSIRELNYQELRGILDYINQNILPYINDNTTAGQDLLSLFFTTFNKFVGKSDKNQAFTPDHICDFMSKAVGVNKNSRVLDPCCGSGAFLVRAMTDAMNDCDSEEEKNAIKSDQIYGIEYEEGAYGLASTNMLIHGDGNSNIVCDSMFNRGNWIRSKNINVVLMNPPYNANRRCCNSEFTRNWRPAQKEDPSEGFHFVKWVADHVSTNCKMAVLLPTQAAIGSKNQEIRDIKRQMLERYTLDAVFSLPQEMFYPGASAIAVCMIFDLSNKHENSNRDTFFGYFRDDKFRKRKNLGRVEMTDENGESLWTKTEELWLNLYRNRVTIPGLSVTHRVTADDEWLAEAFMETDYSNLTNDDFQKTLNDYLGFLVKEGDLYEP